MEVLVEISALDTASGSRVTLRLSSTQDPRVTALNNVPWRPAIKVLPELSHDFFDGDFTGAVSTGGMTMQVQLSALRRSDANAAGYRYARAPVVVYAAEPGTAWPWPVVFDGLIETGTIDKDVLALNCIVDVSPFEASALPAVYAGTGGIEGGADLKNRPKPLCLGAPRNVEPVLIDAVNRVYQFSAYGRIVDIEYVYERGAAYGAAVADYADYAALVAATIPSGRWGACLNQGLIRLGADPTGPVTADIKGDFGSSTWWRTPGQCITRILAINSIDSSRIDSASLAALDTALAALLPDDGKMSLYLTEQVKIIDLVERLVRPCNAHAGVSWTGKLFVARLGSIGSAAATLDALGRQKPPVLKVTEEATSAPYWRIEMGGVRSQRVHGAQEIAFFAELLEKGDYDGSETYREGNIVTNQGARWVYINPIPTAGNAPPALPTTSNSYWSALTGRTDFQDITGTTKPESNATAGDNLIFNAGLTSGTAGWTVGAGFDRVAPSAPTPAAFAFRINAGGGASSTVANGGGYVPLTARTLHLSLNLFRGGSSAGTATARIYFYTAANVFISSEGIDLMAFTTGTWQFASVAVQAPANATSWRLQIDENVTGDTVFIANPRVSPSQSGADVTAQNQARLEVPAGVTVNADYTGLVLTGQLPRDLTVKRFRGTTDVSSTTTWSVATVSCTASINSSGVVTLSAVSSTGKIAVTAVRDGITLNGEILVTKVTPAAPVSGGSGGGGGGGTATDPTISATSSTSYGAANSDVLRVTAGSAGVVDLSAALTFSTAGSGGSALGKWQWRAIGGSFADVAAEIASTSNAIAGDPNSGYIEVTQSKTGLTNGVDYEFQLLLRRGGGSGSMTFAGTAAAVAA